MSTVLPIEILSSLDEPGIDDPLVGRQRELKAITASLATVVTGNGRLDIVTAAAGLGKTRLAREVASIARREGFTVLRGACWEGEGAPAYWPWVDLLRGHLEDVGDPAAAATDLSELLRAASARLPVVARTAIHAVKDAQQARFMLFDWVCEVFAALAARRPTLAIIENLHWADAGSLLLLQFIVERLPSLPIGLLATGRDPLPAVAKELGRHEAVAYRTLDGLTRNEAVALFASRVERVPPADVFDQVMQLTGGNPYFLCELAQMWKEKSQAGPQAIVGLPTSLAALTQHQVGRLSPTGLALVRAASVIGRGFDPILAARVSDVPIAEAMRQFDDAVTQRILTRLPAGRYRFRHALVREAIDAQIQPGDRTRLHERIAVTLEQEVRAGRPVSATALAHHFCMALPFTHRRRAGAYAIAAGEAAQDTLAYEDAILQFRRAQDAYESTLPNHDLCDLLILRGDAEASAGEWERSKATFSEAIALARLLNAPDLFARAALGFKGLMSGTLPVDFEAITLLHEAEDRLGRLFPASRVKVYSAISVALYFSDDRECIISYRDRATSLARTLNDDHMSAIALNATIIADWRPSEVASLKHDADELLRLGIRCADPCQMFHARVFRYWCQLTAGFTRDAVQDLVRASDSTGATDDPRIHWELALLRSAYCLARGQLAQATALTSLAHELGQRVHDSSPAHHHLMQTLQFARFTRDFQGWISTSAPTIDKYSDALSYQAARAFLAVQFGQLDGARMALRHFTASHFSNVPDNCFTLLAFAVLTEAIVAVGDTVSAQQVYSRLQPHRDQHIVAGWGTVIDGHVSHYLALLASCLGRPEEARAHFEAALQGNALADFPPLMARTQLEYARFHVAHSTEAAPTALGLALESSDTLRNCGFTAYAQEADSLAQQIQERLAVCRASAPASDSAGIQVATPSRSTQPDGALVRQGDVWEITYAGQTSHVRHLVGFAHIAAILEADGEPVHVLDLVSPGSRRSNSHNVDLGADVAARNDYKQRLRALDSEIDEATDHNDLGRLDLLQQEHAALVREISYSYGLSGRARPIGSATERARINVKNRISSALNVLRQVHAPAARHLLRAIRTGAACQYSPEAPLRWTVVTESPLSAPSITRRPRP